MAEGTFKGTVEICKKSEATRGKFDHLLALPQVGTKPLQSLVEPVARGGTCRLDVLNEVIVRTRAEREQEGEAKAYPRSLPQTMQPKLVGNFGGIHCILEKTPKVSIYSPGKPPSE